MVRYEFETAEEFATLSERLQVPDIGLKTELRLFENKEKEKVVGYKATSIAILTAFQTLDNVPIYLFYAETITQEDIAIDGSPSKDFSKKVDERRDALIEIIKKEYTQANIFYGKIAQDEQR